jgi:hypothetical protein
MHPTTQKEFVYALGSTVLAHSGAARKIATQTSFGVQAYEDHNAQDQVGLEVSQGALEVSGSHPASP